MVWEIVGRTEERFHVPTNPPSHEFTWRIERGDEESYVTVFINDWVYKRGRHLLVVQARETDGRSVVESVVDAEGTPPRIVAVRMDGSFAPET